MATQFGMLEKTDIYAVEKIDIDFLLDRLFIEGARSTTKSLGDRTEKDLTPQRKVEVAAHVLSTGFSQIQLKYYIAVPLEDEDSDQANAWIEKGVKETYFKLIEALFQHEEIGSYARETLQNRFIQIYGFLPDTDLINCYIDLKFDEGRVTEEAKTIEITPNDVLEQWELSVGEYISNAIKDPIIQFDGEFYAKFFYWVNELFTSLDPRQKGYLRASLLQAYKEKDYFKSIIDAKQATRDLKDPITIADVGDEIPTGLLMQNYASSMYFQLLKRYPDRIGIRLEA
ncbi:MAG: hypothetical protein ACMG57_01290 [Candidatus Dojkabacteria bacterium]